MKNENTRKIPPPSFMESYRINEARKAPPQNRQPTKADMKCPIHGMLKPNPQFMKGVRSWSCTECDYRYEIDETDKNSINQRLTMSIQLKPHIEEEGTYVFNNQPNRTV